MHAYYSLNGEIACRIPLLLTCQNYCQTLAFDLVPLRRKPGSHEPMTLFSKYGSGRLDMYVLNPVEGSKELNHMTEKYGVAGHFKIPAGKTGVGIGL